MNNRPTDVTRDRVPLTNLVLEERNENTDIRAALQHLEAAESITVTPSASVQYLDLRNGRKSTAKQDVDPDLKGNIAMITQSMLDIKFSLDIKFKNEVQEPPVVCDLYFDSTSDNLIISNLSRFPFEIRCLPDTGAGAECQPEQVLPQRTKLLSPGMYDLIGYKKHILVLRILPRVDVLNTTPHVHRPASPNVRKRGLDLGKDMDMTSVAPNRQIPKTRHDIENRSALFLSRTANSISSSSTVGNPFVDLCQHGVLEVPGANMGGYQIHKRKIIARRNQSEVYLAHYSGISDEEIVVKVIKHQIKNQRSLMVYAEGWLREYQIHSGLKHDSIVALRGGDARYLALFLEYAPGYDLSVKDVWRNLHDHYFRGSEAVAFQVLIDVTSALEYLHGLGLVHNDIKPGNILFSEHAVLCDFGVSCQTDSSNRKGSLHGGTAAYIPPEYITVNQRGEPGDVWALGVTMLYLRKMFPLPEASKNAEFIINDIHSMNEQRQQEARTKMGSWLTTLGMVREGMECSSGFDLLIWEMLSPRRTTRPSTPELVKRVRDLARSGDYRLRVKVQTGTRGIDMERVHSQRSNESATEVNDSVEWVPRSPAQ